MLEFLISNMFAMLNNTTGENWCYDLPLPLFLLKNLSSAFTGGRELSVGMQYL